jgi:hypothetical protein
VNLGRLINPGGIAVVCAVGVLSAILEVLLIPLRIGAVMIPITVLFAIGGNVALPQLAKVFVDASGAMVAAFLSWLLPMLVLSLLPRPEGDVLVRGGGGEQWVYYGVLLGGAIAGTATVVLQGPPRRPPVAARPVGRPPVQRRPAQRPAAQRQSSQPRPGQRRPAPKRGR